MATKRPKSDVLHPAYLRPVVALRRIVDELDRQEWNADTPETIARICRLAGYEVREPDQDDDQETSC